MSSSETASLAGPSVSSPAPGPSVSQPSSNMSSHIKRSGTTRPNTLLTESLTTRFDFDQPAIIFSSISTLVSIIILILSGVIDQGRWSIYLSPVVAGLTLIFHGTHLVLGQMYKNRIRRSHIQRCSEPGVHAPIRRGCPPAYSIHSILSTYALLVLWIGALAATALSVSQTIQLLGHVSGENYFTKRVYALLAVELSLIGIELLFQVVLIVTLSRGRKHYLRRRQAQTSTRPQETLEEGKSKVAGVS